MTSVEAAARLVGVSRRTLQRWVADDRIVVHDGGVSVEEAASLRDVMRTRRADTLVRQRLP